MTLEGLRIVVDAGNGATYKSTPCVLRELGAKVTVLNDKPDGTNINKECGSTYPNVVCRAMREHGADIGLSHDGDGTASSCAMKREASSMATMCWQLRPWIGSRAARSRRTRWSPP